MRARVDVVLADSDRIAEYEMKLMDIDSDQLGIPETDYDARVTMPASDFSRIVRDLASLGESVRIEVSKEGVRFASDGEGANGSVLLKQTDAARAKYAHLVEDGPSAGGDDDEDEEAGDKEEGEGDKEEGEGEGKKKKKKVKTEDVEMNGDDEDEDGEEFKAKSDDEGEDEQDDDDDSNKKKRKKAPTKVRLLPVFPFLACGTNINSRRANPQLKKPKSQTTANPTAASPLR